jgi:hypothetical protein
VLAVAALTASDSVEILYYDFVQLVNSVPFPYPQAHPNTCDPQDQWFRKDAFDPRYGPTNSKVSFQLTGLIRSTESIAFYFDSFGPSEALYYDVGTQKFIANSFSRALGWIALPTRYSRLALARGLRFAALIPQHV